MGHSGNDAIVLAAVLPAVITVVVAAGMVVAYRQRSDNGTNNNVQQGVVNFCIVLFMVFLFVGAGHGINARAEASAAYEVMALSVADAHENEHFINCSLRERRINLLREKLELSPLDSQVFCRVRTRISP